jgi:phage N-6-adenine-methyltransferase
MVTTDGTFHRYANLFPMMEGEDLQALADDIRQHGQHEWITVYQGQILDGRNRYRACLMANREPKFAEFWERTDEAALAYVLSRNLHRRHLTSSQRAVLALEVEPLFAEAARERQRRAAGQTNAKLNRAHDETLTSRLTEALDRAEAREQAAKVANVSTGYVSYAKQVAQASPELLEQVRTGEKTLPEAVREIKPALQPLMTSNSYEWYTPADIIARARQCFEGGTIDLDPCSSAEANAVVGAERYFTLQDDGLAQDWGGNPAVWMNPPYGDSIERWVDKLLTCVEDYEVHQALALLPARTDTGWFRALRDYPRCFINGRLKFGGPGANGNSATFPSVIVALGDIDIDDFAEAFSDLGDIYTRYGA